MVKTKAKKKKKVLVKDLVHPARQPIKHSIKAGDTVTFTKETIGNLGGYKIGEKAVVISVKEDKNMMGGYQVTVEPRDVNSSNKNPQYPIIFFTDTPCWFGASTIRETKKDEKV